MHTYFKNTANGFSQLYTGTEMIALGPVVQERLGRTSGKTFAKKFGGHEVTSSARLVYALEPAQKAEMSIRMFEAFPGGTT